MCFFSIIIPAYNAAITIKVCLDSILSQTFSNYEILVVDGLSKDHTASIVNQISKHHKNIRLISEKDNGIYDAMNKGIKQAKGDWLFFMGSDDSFYSIDVLQNIHDSIENNKALDVIYGNVFSERFNGAYNGMFYDEKLYYENICHQSIFFHKNVFSKIGNFNLNYKAHADWEHNMKWFLSPKVNKKYIDIIVANYADGGFSSQHGDSQFEEDKIFVFLKNGYQYSPKSVRHRLWTIAIKTSIKNRDIIRMLKLLFYYRFVLPRANVNQNH